MAEPKPPTSPFWQFFRRGAPGKELGPEAALSPASQMEPSELQFTYRTVDPHELLPRGSQYPMAKKGVTLGLLQQQWTLADAGNVALFSAVPLGISIYNMSTIGGDPLTRSFIQNTPYVAKLLPPPTACVVLNLAATAPLGYATYVVWKVGNGFASSENKVALGLYGFTLFCLTVQVPALTSHNKRWIAGSGLMLAAGAAATAYSFCNIDRTAGFLTIPFAAWAAWQTLPWLLNCCPRCCSSSGGSDDTTTAVDSTRVPPPSIVSGSGGAATTKGVVVGLTPPTVKTENQ